MDQKFEELNENVVFMYQTLTYVENVYGKKLELITNQDTDYLIVKKLLSMTIQTCTSASLQDSSSFGSRRAKLEIFSYLLKAFFALPTIVPPIKVNQLLLFDLMVDGQFEDLQDILSSMNKSRYNQFNEDLIDYLRQKESTGQFNSKLSNFCVDWLLSGYNVHIYKILSSNLIIGIDPIYVGKILDKIIEFYDETSTEDLHSFLKSEHLKRLCCILKLITSEFTNLSQKIKIHNLKKFLNFLSYINCENSIEPQDLMKNLFDYLVQLIKQNYDLELSPLFAIRHRLYGYERHTKEFIHNLSVGNAKTFTQDDLETLKLVTDQLTGTNSSYLMLKILDRQPENHLTKELCNFFWLLFDNLTLDQKTSLIFMIYQLKEIKINKVSVTCLQSENFDREFTLCLNQVSATSDQDEQFLARLSKLMCISVKCVVDKLFYNILFNKSQVNFLTRILFRFGQLLKIDSPKSIKSSILIDCLKSNLAFILDTRNDKMLQNYSQFLKLCLKSDSGLLDPNEFYSKVIYEYFKVDTIDVELCFSILDIYETLLKYINLDMAQIVYVIELYSNFSLECAGKQADLDKWLKSTEKCLMLIKQMTKLAGRFKLDDAKEIDNFKILVKKYYWTTSLLVYPITKQIYIPECLNELMSGIQAKITIIEVDDSSFFESLIELISIEGFAINIELINHDIKSDEILKALIKVLSLNKTSYELKNIFSFLYQGFKKTAFKFQEEKFSSYSQWLNLLVCSTTALAQEERNTEFIVINLIKFLKEMVNKDSELGKDYQISFYLETVTYLLKLSFFLKEYESKEILGFLVEFSNNAFFPENQNWSLTLVQDCLILIEQIDDNYFKNFKYLIKKNIEKLLI